MKRLFKETTSTAELTSQLSEARKRVRALLSEDRIDEALRQLQEISESQDAELSNKFIILTRRFNRVTQDERIKTVTREEADAEKNQIVQDLLHLVDQLDHRPKKRSPVRKLTPRAESAESAARTRYLGILKKNVENLLDVSIHKARMKDLGIDDDAGLNIDLDVNDTPAATSLPWIYIDPNSTQEFAHIEEAFDTYERRLLLLGGPGSGKTTTLLSITQQLIREAEDDPSAPIPLFVNLSKLPLKPPTTSAFNSWVGKQPSKDRRDERVERWLVTELTTGYPGISTEVARAWITEGRVAALLDGLDEVGDEYRAELAKVLNDTYLRDYPDTVVVVCSRINEYLPLQDHEETRLQLKGAVTLQPLTRSQISAYLEKAQATGLGEALRNDETLYQMAQTPLMLSMMTLAYGGVAPSAIPPHLSKIERRHHLMEAYVARMLQRKERRDRGIPFDEDKRKDVPAQRYAYRPEQINGYLGWLAVRLSVRMQTAVSLDSLYRFLIREIQRDRQSGVWWATAISRTPIIFFSAVLAGLTVAPMTTQGWRHMLSVGLLGALLYVPLAWKLRSDDKQSGAPQATRYGFISRVARQVVGGGAIVLISLVILCGGLGAVSLGLSSALPFGIPPAPTGLIALCLSIVLVMALMLVSGEGGKFKYWFIGSSLGVFFAALAVMRGQGGSEYGWYIPALSLLAIQTISACVSITRDEKSWGPALAISGTVGGLFLFQLGAIRLIGDLNWYHTLILCVAVAALTMGLATKPLLPLSCLISSFAIGGLVGGSTGSAIGLLIFGYLLLLYFFVVEEGNSLNRLVDRIESFTEYVAERLERVGDRYLLSPILLRVVALTRCLPLRFKPFSKYAERALLLKRSAGDIEFMHRLLRDYFALRDLQPLLTTTDSARRLEAIRNLGFQGDAAIDALADFVRSGEPEVREAAAWAFGRIASPEVIPHIEVALRDDDPKVRSTAVFSTRNLPGQDLFRLLSLVMDDKDLSVQRACIEVALSSNEYSFPSLRGEGLDIKERINANIRNRDELRHVVFQLLETSRNDDVRYAAIEIILQLKDKRGVPSLIAALSDRVNSTRWSAAHALGELGDPRAVKPLIKVLSVRDKYLRSTAVHSLRKIGTPEALAAVSKEK